MTAAPKLEPDWADQAEQRLLDAALPHVEALGWTQPLVWRAAADAGFSRGDAGLILPHGPADLAALLSRRHDDRAFEALAALDPKALKVRERIFRGVEARMEAAADDLAAVRRWAAWLAWPTRTPLALRLVWESADRIWRWAGDTATDENHYSKRAILSGILISTLGVRLSQGREAATAFLTDRIDNVMAFEKWKAQIKPADYLREMAAALARLRYGAGRG